MRRLGLSKHSTDFYILVCLYILPKRICLLTETKIEESHCAVLGTIGRRKFEKHVFTGVPSHWEREWRLGEKEFCVINVLGNPGDAAT